MAFLRRFRSNKRQLRVIPRSTVGTVTEIYDYLRLLFARVGVPHCYQCEKPIASQTVQQIVDRVLDWEPGSRIHILAPLVRDRKGEYRKELADLQKAGFARVRVDGEMRELAEEIVLKKTHKHTIDVVVDRLVVKKGIAQRLADSLETALGYGGDVVTVEQQVEKNGPVEEHVFSQKLACPDCGISYPEIEPRTFSFNSPHGACPDCSGLGVEWVFDEDRVVPDETLSLNKGAIAPWARKAETYKSLLTALAKHLKISLDTPMARSAGSGS